MYLSLFLVKLNNIFRPHLYFSQKQLPRKMELRLVITKCAGYTFRQLFLWEVYVRRDNNFLNLKI